MKDPLENHKVRLLLLLNNYQMAARRGAILLQIQFYWFLLGGARFKMPNLRFFEPYGRETFLWAGSCESEKGRF